MPFYKKMDYNAKSEPPYLATTHYPLFRIVPLFSINKDNKVSVYFPKSNIEMLTLSEPLKLTNCHWPQIKNHPKLVFPFQRYPKCDPRDGCQMLRGEIPAPNFYHHLRGKIEGTKSTSYYSIKEKPSLTYFIITTTQIVSKKSHK
jgi:hypothetical protein